MPYEYLVSVKLQNVATQLQHATAQAQAIDQAVDRVYRLSARLVTRLRQRGITANMAT